MPHRTHAIPHRAHRRGDRSFILRSLSILGKTGAAYWSDHVSRLGAALAFYTTLAVAPLLILAIAAAGVIFDDGDAKERVIREIQMLAGSPASEALKTLQNPLATTTGTVATLIGVATLVFGAMGVFEHIQDALNSIWRVPPAEPKGWLAVVRYRLFSIATILMTGFLLLVSLIVSSVLSWFGSQTAQAYGLSVSWLQFVNNTISFGAVWLLFALIFKLLPDTRVAWRHVWLGSLGTAFLFTIGKIILGVYLGRASVTSAYGAAGSFVALLLWCYYAGQIVFLGAEFTRVAALSNGGRDFSALSNPAERKRTA